MVPKKLEINEAYKNKRIYLVFDGVMAFPEVYINGKLAGKWDYGYNSFYLDITDFLNFSEENLLAVHADTREHDSRWYPGGGLYRKVTMLVTDPVHVDIWGTYVTTPIINADTATVRISNHILNTSKMGDSVRLKQVILDPSGEQVSAEKNDQVSCSR